MATKVEIINRSLALIGCRKIVTIADTTKEAETAVILYDIALESLLAETMWTFAMKRELLTLSAYPIAFARTNEGVAYSYYKPTDAVRIFETNFEKAFWFEEGDQILSDTAALGVRYTYLNTDPATYPTYFSAALSDKLAYELSFNMLNSRSQTEALLDKYERISLPKATSMNSQIGTQKSPIDDEWVNAKYTGANTKEF